MGGGGAIHVDLPITKFKTPNPSPSSSLSTLSSVNFPVSVNNNNTCTSSSGSSSSTAAVRQQQHSCTDTSCCCCMNRTNKVPEHVSYGRMPSGSLSNVVFGSVPSPSEVGCALTSLQNFMQRSSTSALQFGQFCSIPDCGGDVRAFLSNGYGRVVDAFNLLQTDPSIKRLVVSLATDKAVWDAVMNNEMVQKLRVREPKDITETEQIQGCDEQHDLFASVLRWIMEIMKGKITELIDKFQALMNEVVSRPSEREQDAGKCRHDVDDKVRSSLLLSILILLIVAVARFHQIRYMED